MNECGCRPGSYDNGWHEQRCEMCLAVEMEAFGRAMRRVPEIVARLREGKP